MFLSFVLITLITACGLSLTYLFAEDEPLLWRICAGNVVGSAVFGLVCFLLACFFGFNAVTVSLAVLICLSPLLLFYKKTNRVKLLADWRKAKGKLEGATLKKTLRLAHYVFFFVLFIFFFERAIFQMPNAIFTGGSQNFGDLPFHLGAIFSFTDGNNFPPENPSYAFAKFSYPFMADLITATFVKLGANLHGAMLVQNVTLAFSLLVVLERFVSKFTGNRLAGKIAPALLFFSGGLGFLWFVYDFWQYSNGIFEFLGNLPQDYTISNKDNKNEEREIFRWGNSLVVLFITQRSLLLGMPLTIIVLQKLWEIFSSQQSTVISHQQDKNFQPFAFSLSPFAVGLLAGTLPLIHVHSLAVLFVVSAFLFFLRLDRWREWIAFGVGVSIVAVPELVWAMSGSATQLTEFVAWNFGWDKRGDNAVWFWLKNTGAFIPVLILGIYAVFSLSKNEKENREQTVKQKKSKDTYHLPFTTYHVYFYLPFLFCFVVANLIKLAPWEWDNIKVLIYWFVGSLPFAAFILARLWIKNKAAKIVAIALLIVLTLAGALDVWRTVSRQSNYKLFEKDAIAIAEQIKRKTPPNSLFLNMPTFNTAIVLSGRRSLMRYPGHLASYGIDFREREDEVKRIYAGDAAAEILLGKYNVEYVLVSPEEKSNLPVNENFFRRYPVAAEVGEYRVYQIKR